MGIPGNVLDAYQFAQQTLTETQPGCHLSWSVLAGIGRIESDHASGGRLDALGNTLGVILGPRLDGSPGLATVPDTDHGVLDGDTVWDRAVGPMQFIPATWRQWGVDGNGDGVVNPNDIYDATITAARYLCAGGADLADPTQLQQAVYRYNQSAAYVSLVLQWARAYLTGVVPTPAAPGPVPPGTTGNGGRSIVTAPAPPAAAALAAAAPTTPSLTPPTTTPSPPPPMTTTTPSVTTPIPTTPTPPPPAFTPTPSVTTTMAATPSPPSPGTTMAAGTATPAATPPVTATLTTTPHPPPPPLMTTSTLPTMTSSALSSSPLSTDPPPPR